MLQKEFDSQGNSKIQSIEILQAFLAISVTYICWARGDVVVKALGYKPEGRGFVTQ
jgi:hypothetical protein